MTDFKPGQIAKATVRGVPDVTVMRSDDRKRGTLVWASSRGIEGDYWFTPDDVTDVRPLVVLDLAAAFDFDEHATPGKFLRAVAEHARLRGQIEDPPNIAFVEWIADQIEAQTRPTIEEPTGLGAVVESHDALWWVRTSGGIDGFVWQSGNARRRWADVKAVRVLSEGVQP